MDVRTEMLVFPGFRGPDRSFCPRTSAGISVRMSAGYPAPKLTLWAAFSFLNISLVCLHSLSLYFSLSPLPSFSSLLIYSKTSQNFPLFCFSFPLIYISFLVSLLFRIRFVSFFCHPHVESNGKPQLKLTE